MSFPAGLSGSVVALPPSALLVEPIQPFTSFGVEAFWVGVVAGVVIFGGHAIQRRVKLCPSGVDTLVGLLERQRNTTALQVDVDNLDKYLLVGTHDLLGQVDVLVREFGDVHEAFDAIGHADKRSERHQFGDVSGSDLTDGVGASKYLPGVFLGGFERQGDAFAVHVHFQHLDGDLLADLHHFAGVVDVLPGQLGDVNETVHPAEIHKRTKVHDGGNNTLADLPLLQVGEERAAGFALALLKQCPA